MEKPLEAPGIYLDFNASTPIAPEVADAMRGVFAEPFGNPSSEHWAGEPAKRAIEKARTQVAALLKCRPSEIVFTSGGSEANNHALKGVLR
jgi:cysteine desulfurase